MTDKWYNSKLGNGLGIAAIVLATGLGIAKIVENNDYDSDGTKQIKIRYEHKLQEADLNGNGVLDKFYTIDKKIALVELDGKPVSEFYRK